MERKEKKKEQICELENLYATWKPSVLAFGLRRCYLSSRSEVTFTSAYASGKSWRFSTHRAAKLNLPHSICRISITTRSRQYTISHISQANTRRYGATSLQSTCHGCEEGRGWRRGSGKPAPQQESSCGAEW